VEEQKLVRLAKVLEIAEHAMVLVVASIAKEQGIEHFMESRKEVVAIALEENVQVAIMMVQENALVVMATAEFSNFSTLV